VSKYRITLEGKTYEMEVELVADAAQPAAKKEKKEYKGFKNTEKDPTIMVVDPATERMTPASNQGAVTSPMPGTVIRLAKGEGDTVKAGELVLVLEAMKMENEILAPVDGTIVKMNYAAGETVSGGAILFEVQ
jgi:biotin carboxyl carrier protein